MLSILSNSIDFFFPKVCIISDIKIPQNNSNPYISDEIIKNLDKPSRQDLYLLENKLDANNTFTCFVTKGNNDVNKILHHLKYKGFSNLGLFFGEYISENVLENYSDIRKKYNIICPVPLHKTKLRERGYNQSDFIVRGINKTLKLDYFPELVIRSRYTKSQTKLPYPERVSNVKNAFNINPKFANMVKKKHIILVDDVVTSGSTLNEVIKVLKESGATNVFAVTIAMAKGE